MIYLSKLNAGFTIITRQLKSGRVKLAISLGFGRTGIFGLLFVIFYFYNFIKQRLGADTAMNSLPAAMPNRWRPS